MRLLSLAIGVVLVAPAARADDARFGVAALVGATFDHRFGAYGVQTSVGAPTFGGELRAAWRDQGIALAYTVVPTEVDFSTSEGFYGPAVHFVDVGYTYEFFRAKRVTWTLELGPSLAVVERTFAPTSGQDHEVDVPWHATFGGLASVAIHSHAASGFFFGVELGYRGGLPLVSGPAWEGAGFVMLTIGGESLRAE